MRFAGAFVVAFACLVLLPQPSRGASAPALVKLQQRERMIAEPMRERRERRREWSERVRELRRLARKAVNDPGQRSRRTDEPAPAPAPSAGRLVTRASGSSPVNRLVNDRAGDANNSGQSETSIVAWRNYVVAAWNDGQGYIAGGGDGQGYATSVDGGVTWVDRGNLPPIPGFPSFRWASDPSLAVDEKTGEFFYAGLCDPNLSTNGIGVVKGTFTGSTFAWQTPAFVRSVSNSTDGLDKEWIVADSLTGNLYVSYTRFFDAGAAGVLSEINFQRSIDGGLSWSPAIKVSLADPLEDGWVQGSRPIVSPDGTVLVEYYRIGQIDADDYRVARSTNAGVSFGVPVTAVTFYSNFGTGAPGFNRDIGINFASAAVDRSTGPHRGRYYLSWAESFNWYDDLPSLGTAGSVTGVENNNAPASATPFVPGVTLRDSLAIGDQDWFRFSATAGQHLIVRLDSLASGVAVDMWLYAPDGTSKLAYGSAQHDQFGTLEGFWTWTMPVDGTYYVALTRRGAVGRFRLRTGFGLRGLERGRDQRDAFVSTSDDGITWSNPSRASDSPIGYDDWLPEVTASARGSAYVAWYDWRDAPVATAGAESNVALARSDDGGASWTPLGPITDVRTAWTGVASNIAPNQGDYISAFANDSSVFVSWADGRPIGGLSNPDVYAAVWPLEPAGLLVTVTSVTADPSGIHVVWTLSPSAGFTATLYTREEGGAWQSQGTVVSNPSGQIDLTLTPVVPGHRYEFRLGVPDGGGGELFYGYASVIVPLAFPFALEGARPNPATTSLEVSLTLPDGSPATLELLDLAGRTARRRDVGALGAGTHLVDLKGPEPLAPGMYVVRLRQAGRERTKRVAFVR